MPLALIHAKRFTNSLSCEQMIAVFLRASAGSPDSQGAELNRFASCGAEGDFFATDLFSGNIFG
jgi:hypothetical protein